MLPHGNNSSAFLSPPAPFGFMGANAVMGGGGGGGPARPSSVALAQRNLESSKQQQSQLQQSIHQRIVTLEVSERLQMKREQQLAVREVAMQRALSLCPNGPIRDWERHVSDMISQIAVSLPPPQPSIAIVARELEDRAVELECLIHQHHMKQADMHQREEELRRKEAKLRSQELELSAWQQNASDARREIEQHEARVRNMEADLQRYQSQVSEWAKRLQEREDAMKRAEERAQLTAVAHTQVDSGAAAAAAVTSNSDSGAPVATLRQSLSRGKQVVWDEDTMLQARDELVEVSKYLKDQLNKVANGREWVRRRAMALEEVLQRIETLHMNDITGFEPEGPPPLPRAEHNEVRSFLEAFEVLAVSVRSPSFSGQGDKNPKRLPPPPLDTTVSLAAETLPSPVSTDSEDDKPTVPLS